MNNYYIMLIIIFIVLLIIIISLLYIYNKQHIGTELFSIKLYADNDVVSNQKLMFDYSVNFYTPIHNDILTIYNQAKMYFNEPNKDHFSIEQLNIEINESLHILKQFYKIVRYNIDYILVKLHNITPLSLQNKFKLLLHENELLMTQIKNDRILLKKSLKYLQ